ncbi:response regulator transcription factor [Candidatus Uhrbacteria bacterium]|nr:response regulator transcription factor [Candidatus Uhrbacteria bacterium]
MHRPQRKGDLFVAIADKAEQTRVKAILSELGFSEPSVHSTAEDLLRIAVAVRIHATTPLAIIDVDLDPLPNGENLQKKLQTIDIPVITLTREIGDRAKALSQGIWWLVRKPLRKHELLAAITNVLGGKKMKSPKPADPADRGIAIDSIPELAADPAQTPPDKPTGEGQKAPPDALPPGQEL